ncbi:MAG: GNAT family N-acetyltransferase [Planctomycetota bacterium]
MISRSEPIFAVRDVNETLAFYRDVLGGGGEWTYGDPPGFGGVRLGSVQLCFQRQPEVAGKIEGLEHFLFAEQIDALYEQHAAAGAPIVEPIENKPWGLREYVVRDPNGYRLRIHGPPTFDKPAGAADTLPDHVAIETRLPTYAEYQTLKRSVEWNTQYDRPELLSTCCAGVTAVDRGTGRAIGMARAVRDAPAWFSVWDVVVEPAHQHRRVGTALIERLLAELRTIGPAGANVVLFTFHDSFYERLGFQKQPSAMLRL